MTSQRFTGPNSRAVLRQVRAVLGADAVILASRALAGGAVEMLAAPYDALGGVAPAPAPHVVPVAQVPQAAPAAAPAPAAPRKPAAEEAALLREIREMKRTLEAQLAGLAWTESHRRSPLRGELMRQLLGAGFSPLLSRRLLERLPDDFSRERAQGWLLSTLEKNLACAPRPGLAEQGGVIALVGPTGVGKTTTAAKLAAHCVMKHGGAGLGLVTTDGYRVGAHDQLRAFAKILGVPVLTAQDPEELAQALQALAGKRLVLIDTAGHGQRDPRVAEQHRLLSSQGVKRLLVLNAAAQAETLEQVAAAYAAGGAGAPLAGAVLAKTDEAAKLGGALDILLRHRLELHYVANGQRVPEDLHASNARVLAHRALREERDAPAAFRLDAVAAGTLGA